MNHLTGKVALITGGSRGIGRAIALAYAKNGVSVAFSYVNDKSAAEETSAMIDSHCVKSLAVHADVREESSIKEMVSRSIEAFGQIDILVNNAGITMPKPWQQLTTQDWNTVIATNLTSAFLATQEVAPAMVSRQWAASLCFRR
jgi:3-oxoacyl-[acyl-carrier protein] reductase